MQTDQLKDIAINALEDIKAQDIVTLDVRAITTIADIMIICSARSSRQLKALANEVVVKAKEQGFTPLSNEGNGESGWVLVDLGDVIVHIMMPETREFYQLEKLWSSDDDQQFVKAS
jgi:ribosome-associated protein